MMMITKYEVKRIDDENNDDDDNGGDQDGDDDTGELFRAFQFI